MYFRKPLLKHMTLQIGFKSSFWSSQLTAGGDIQPGLDVHDSAHLLKKSRFGGIRNDGENKGLYLLRFHNSYKAVRLKPSYLSEADSSRMYCAESKRGYSTGKLA